jgi:deoxyribonuclease-2
MSDSTAGFWLVHSVPKFPIITNEYKYPDTGKRNGQSFLCMTLSFRSIDVVGGYLH